MRSDLTRNTQLTGLTTHCAKTVKVKSSMVFLRSPRIRFSSLEVRKAWLVTRQLRRNSLSSLLAVCLNKGTPPPSKRSIIRSTCRPRSNQATQICKQPRTKKLNFSRKLSKIRKRPFARWQQTTSHHRKLQNDASNRLHRWQTKPNNRNPES